MKYSGPTLLILSSLPFLTSALQAIDPDQIDQVQAKTQQTCFNVTGGIEEYLKALNEGKKPCTYSCTTSAASSSSSADQSPYQKDISNNKKNVTSATSGNFSNVTSASNTSGATHSENSGLIVNRNNAICAAAISLLVTAVLV